MRALITTTCYHFDREAGYNEFNPGVGIETDHTAFGCYYNSYHKMSWYGLVHYGPLIAGVVTGYDKKFRCIVAPVLKIGALRVGIKPCLRTGAVALSLSLKTTKS